MSDHDQPAPGEPDFDDPAYDELRALLAEARLTEPVPAEVAARLDATLAALRDQQRVEAPRKQGSVVVLRRRVGQLLVAAAAVGVIGAGTVGIVQSGRNGGDGDEATSSTAGGQADADKAAPSAPEGLQSPGVAAGELWVNAASLRSTHFAQDATAAMRTLAAEQEDGTAAGKAATPSGPTTQSAPSDTTSGYAADAPVAPVTATPAPLASRTQELRGAAQCPGPSAPGAVTLPATLDGVPVALVFRPPTPAKQVVEAWSCDGSSLMASATVRL